MMIRTMAVAVLFFSAFSCFVGCATTPESKKVEDKVENKISENKVSEWKKLPDNPENPNTQVFENTRTKAFVSISFLSGKMKVSDTISREAEFLFNEGMDTSKVVLSDNDETGTCSFTGLLSGQPINGMTTVMRLEPNRPLVMIRGVWPIEFDEEMTTHYKGITKEVVYKLKSAKQITQ